MAANLKFASEPDHHQYCTVPFFQVESNWGWQIPAMLGCSTVCPKCQHQFECCSQSDRRSRHSFSGGGLVKAFPPPEPVSPSVPLTFIIPPSFASILQHQVAQAPFARPACSSRSRPDSELKRLTNTVRNLRLSGWYFEDVTHHRSEELLSDKPVGTFLVRDSADPKYLYSLSVKTERGPASIRLFYVNGNFQLSAKTNIQLPSFPGVVELIQYYVDESCKYQKQIFVDSRGMPHSPIILKKPLRKDDSAPSLKHLARLAVHGTLQGSRMSHAQLKLPATLTAYLEEYPYTV